jgi:hypothetical protein
MNQKGRNEQISDLDKSASRVDGSWGTKGGAQKEVPPNIPERREFTAIENNPEEL